MGFACYDAYKEKNNIWFSAIDHNGLYKKNLDNNEIIKLAEFPHEDNIFELHRRIIVHDRVLFFIPYKGKGISTYHLDNDNMDYFIPDDGNDIHASDAFLDGDIIWIIPRTLNQPLYEFNIRQGIFYKHEEWNNRILKIFGINHNNILSLTSTCFFDKTMMTVLFNTPYVIKTNIITGNIDIYYISSEYPLRGISYDRGNYWLTLAKGGSVLYIDFETNNVKIIDLDTSSNAVFMNVIVDNQSVILLPCKDTNIYRICKDTNLSYKYINNMKVNKTKSSLPLYLGWIKDEDDLLLLPSADDKIIRYNKENEQEIDFISKKLKEKSIGFIEQSDLTLIDFVLTAKSYQSIVKSNIDKNSYGSEIWERTKNELSCRL